MLCSNNKMLSKVLATRLGCVLKEVINTDQIYYISIFDNTLLVRDIFSVSKLFGLNMSFISIYQEKAFELSTTTCGKQALTAFVFNLDFISKEQILYCDIKSVLKLNVLKLYVLRLRCVGDKAGLLSLRVALHYSL